MILKVNVLKGAYLIPLKKETESSSASSKSFIGYFPYSISNKAKEITASSGIVALINPPSYPGIKPGGK